MTVRVGVIGTGNIGTAHATMLARTIAGSVVTVVYDFDAERAQAVASAIGARTVGSAQELIDDPEVDAVVISSPDQLHAEQTLACIAAGKPTMCEKPLAPELVDALKVMDAEIAFGRRLVTLGFMRRFDPGYVGLKARITDGTIGDPLMVHCVHRNASVNDSVTSPMTLTNSVIHEMDITRWLTDEEVVAATVLSGRHAKHAAGHLRDPQLVILETESGIIVDIESFVNCQFGYDVRCEVVGSDGTAALGTGSFITTAVSGSRGEAIPPMWLDRFDEAYRVELQAWVDSIRDDKPSGATIWDGYAATAIAHASVAAQTTGQRTEVALIEKPALYR